MVLPDAFTCIAFTAPLDAQCRDRRPRRWRGCSHTRDRGRQRSGPRRRRSGIDAFVSRAASSAGSRTLVRGAASSDAKLRIKRTPRIGVTTRVPSGRQRNYASSLARSSCVRERFEAFRELFELPAARERGGLAPGRLLIAQRRQGRGLVHRGDGFIEKQVFRLRREPSGCENLLERP